MAQYLKWQNAATSYAERIKRSLVRQGAWCST